MPKNKPTLRNNPVNSIFYESEFFRSNEDRRSSFAFCQVYSITDEHGRWTRNLDIVPHLYVEEFGLINGNHVGLYNYCKSLANRKKELSTDGLAQYYEVGRTTITEWLDRLQDVRLLHRICRTDANGGGHDVIIHSPFTYDSDKSPYTFKNFEKIYYPILKGRVDAQITKTSRAQRLEEKTDKNGITRLMRTRETCCADHLKLDLREVRMLYHTGQTKETNDGKIPRKFWKPDKQTDLFLAVLRDALRQLHREGIRPTVYREESAKRTQNWNRFKDVFRDFCERERIGIDLNSSRFKAAWQMVNYYAPNVFYYVEI